MGKCTQLWPLNLCWVMYMYLILRFLVFLCLLSDSWWYNRRFQGPLWCDAEQGHHPSTYETSHWEPPHHAPRLFAGVQEGRKPGRCAIRSQSSFTTGRSKSHIMHKPLGNSWVSSCQLFLFLTQGNYKIGQSFLKIMVLSNYVLTVVMGQSLQ